MDLPDDEKQKKPYLFVLLRPDGLNSYYTLYSALAGLKVDLGYELIDRDWVLDFSDGKIGSGTSTAAIPAATAVGSGKAAQGFHGGLTGGQPPSPGGPTPPKVATDGSGGGPWQPGGNSGTAGGPGPGTPHPGGNSPYPAIPGFPGGGGSPSGGSLSGGPPSGTVGFSPGGGSPGGTIGFSPGGGSPSGNGPGVGSGFGPGMTNSANAIPGGMGGAPGNIANGIGSMFGGNFGGGGGSTAGGFGLTGDLLPSGFGFGGPGGSPVTYAFCPSFYLLPKGYEPGTTGANSGNGGDGLGLALFPAKQGGASGGGAGGGWPGGGISAGKTPALAGGSSNSSGNVGPSQNGGPGPGSNAPPGAIAASPGGEKVATGSPIPKVPGGVAGQPSQGPNGQPNGNATSGAPSMPGMPANGKGGQPGGGSGEPSIPEFQNPLGTGKPRPVSKAPLVLSKVMGNRDWNINIDCATQGITLLVTQEDYSLATLQAKAPGEHPLHKVVRELIARKEATVRPGEPPYRPILYFEVPPGCWRTYFLAQDLLADLQLPAVRRNVPPRQPKLEDYFRK
jgi:hypothetical protein